MFWKIKWSR